MTNDVSTPPRLPLAEIKRQYHAYLGHRASLALDAKARAGGCVGFATTGYTNIDGAAEPDPKLGPLVEEAFRMIAQKRSSLTMVLAELTPRGLVSRSGKPLSPSALARMIQNPFYVGMIHYKGQIYEGTHKALVSPSLFDRAGRSLRRRRR